MISNERGSISLIGVSILAMFVSFFFLGNYKAIKNLKRVQGLKELSLCHEGILSLLKNEISFMAKTNHSIRLAYFATQSPIPQVKAAAELTHKTLMTLQNVRRPTFNLKIARLNYCQLPQKINFQRSLPYSLILKRDLMGVALLEHIKWKIQTVSLNRNDLPLLEAELSVLDSFDNELKIVSQRNPAKAFLSSLLSSPF